ncbi:hypothetical protein ACHAPU_001000 [Fusarium lateritium]
MATFSDLSKELRDKIWNLAIRDDYPGVHIFGACDQAKEEGRPLTSRGDKSCNFYEPSWRGYFHNLKNDCSDENISTYLIDGGLWTACKESRLVMEKHFKQSDWPIRKSFYEHYSYSEAKKYKMPSTGYFAGGPLHCLTTFPNRDLFVFQTNDVNKIPWVCHDRALGANLSGCEHIGHLAIEYRPEWAHNQTKGKVWKRVVRHLANVAFESEGSLFRIWIIDHTLKRRKGAPAYKEETSDSSRANTFYARDRKLLEVDDRFDSNHWQYVGTDGNELKERGSWAMIMVLDVQDMISDRKCEELDYTDLDSHPVGIGLLGWADL